MRDLTQHLTTRADDNHAPPVSDCASTHGISAALPGCQDLVRFFALLRIKPHAPLLVRAPVNSFEFQPCGRTPQAECLLRLLRHCRGRYPQHLAFIVYSVDYQGIQSCSRPTLSRLSVSYGPVSRLRHWCSSQSLRISPLHWEFHLPLPHSSQPVCKAIPTLKAGLSLHT